MSRTPYVPQLAVLVEQPPSGDQWLHEIKFDGYRIGAHVRKGEVTLYTRNGNDWTATFPTIADAVGRLGATDALIDGEVAVMLPDGRTSFQALQNATAGRLQGTLVYVVFDLLRLGGENLETLPLEERKTRLKKLVGRRAAGRIRFSDHVVGHGGEYFEEACRLKLEGIVSKRRDLPYRAGRHDGWVKTKCAQRQEFVIGGFTDPEGSRAGLGALLLGYYDNGALVCCGKVGTGFTQKGARDLRATLDRLERTACPFTPPPARAIARKAHWVRPDLVCEVRFTEWTGDGSIRHPSFQGLRADKRPVDVVREDQVPLAARPGRTSAARASAPPSRRAAIKPDAIAGVTISHPDRLVYPDLGLTKADVARYYEAVGDWIVPHLRDRALTLVRCPEGLDGDCFFMKHSAHSIPAALRRVSIKEKSATNDYLVAGDVAGAVSLIQLGVLEIHTWNSTIDHPDNPNRLVFDLDPGEDIRWPTLVDAARMVRDGLAALSLESYVKTTGGKGLHVVVPLARLAGWPACFEFSRALSARFVQANPTLYTMTFSKAGRRRQILIDYLRNNRGNTSVSAYSTRARAGAPVSVPMTWRELEGLKAPPSFDVRTVPARLANLAADPWAGYWTCRQRLTQRLLRALGITQK
jgi:bifunctional non-homologous end joining protein LigD